MDGMDGMEIGAGIGWDGMGREMKIKVIVR
jgi:hypothetical protein